MGNSVGLTTIKALFAEATHCAYPACSEPLVFEDPKRGVRSIAVQVAHIRSEKPSGPRYDVQYPKRLLNSEENLLLLCGKHHAAVDQHDSVFTTDELLEWKRQQVAQAGGTVVSDIEVTSLIRSLESTLSALYESLRVAVDVDAVGGRLVDGSIVIVPLEGLRAITIDGATDGLKLLGTGVVNKGAAGIEVSSAGVEIDVGHPDEATASWIFDGPYCAHGLPHRLDGRSSAYWFVDAATIRAAMVELGAFAKRPPSRFRPFASFGDGSRETGEWRSGILMPIWRDGFTQTDLDGLSDDPRAGS